MNNDLSRAERSAGQIGKAFAELSRSSSSLTNNISPVGAKAAVSLQTMQARADQLRSSMSSLGAQVNNGSISIDTAARKYQGYASELKKVQGSLDTYAAASQKADNASKGFIDRHGGMTAVLAKSAIAFAAVVKGADFLVDSLKKVAEVAQEGAGIAQLSDSFDNLTKNILGVPDLLNQMRGAAKGTISDVSLMSSFLTVAAGTTGEFGKSLAANVPRIIEIAKAASVLNPALGDTTFFFESLAKGIKRAEFRLVDNLGLNVRVREANARYAESIGVTVKELSAEQRQIAFLNETLRVGGLLIDQVAGKTDSLVDPYQKLTVLAENAGNALKEAFARELVDAMQEVGESTEGVEKNLIDLSTTIGKMGAGVALGELTKLAAVLQVLADIRDPSASLGGLGDFVGLIGKLASFDIGSIEAVIGILREIGVLPKGIDEAARALGRVREEAGRSHRELTSAFRDPVPVMREWTDEAKEAAIAAGDLGGELAGMEEGTRVNPLALRMAVLQGYQAALRVGTEETKKFKEEQKKLNDELAKGIGEELARGIEAQAEAFNALDSRMDAGYNRIRKETLSISDLMKRGFTLEQATVAFEAQSEALANALDVIREKASAAREAFLGIIDATKEDPTKALVSPERDVTFRTGGGATPWQTEALERYQDALVSTGQELFDLQTGFKRVGDSAEDQGEAIAGAHAEMRQYQGAISALGIPATQFGQAHLEMALNIEEFRKANLAAIVAAGASEAAVTSYGIAIGEFSKEEADAAHVTQKLIEAQGRLADKVAQGLISPESMERQLLAIFEGLKSSLARAELAAPVGFVLEPNSVDRLNDFFAGDVGEITVRPIPDMAFFEEEIGRGVVRVPVEIEPTRDVTSGGFFEEVLGQGVTRVEAGVDITTSTDDAYDDIAAWFDGGGERVANFNVKTVDEGDAFTIFQGEVDAWIEQQHQLEITANTDPAADAIQSALAQFENFTITVHANVEGLPGAPPESGPRYDFPEFQHGGFVERGRGLRGGAMPAILHEGEYVLNKNSVDKLGRNFIENLNAGRGGGQNTITLNNYGSMGGGGQGGMPAYGSDTFWNELEGLFRRHGVTI